MLIKKPKVKPKVKRDKLSTHRRKAWEAFSIFIRTRDCLRTTGTLETGRCVTCNHRYMFRNLHAGHFIPGRTNAILFDEQGVHAQCYACNVGKHGATHEYWLYMEHRYGRHVIDDMLARKNLTVKLTASDYDTITEQYIRKTEMLKNGTLNY